MTFAKAQVFHDINYHLNQMTIEITNAAIIINNRITTPVTIKIRPETGSPNFDVGKIHRNIFSIIQLVELILKVITSQGNKDNTVE